MGIVDWGLGPIFNLPHTAPSTAIFLFFNLFFVYYIIKNYRYKKVIKTIKILGIGPIPQYCISELEDEKEQK